VSSSDRLDAHRREQARQLFGLGRTSIKTGDRAHGRELLLKAVEYDRDHSEAWLWLSATTDDPAEQKKYLEWAVAANPANAAARRGLAILTGKLNPRDVLPEGQSPEPRRPAQPETADVRRTFDCPQCGGRLRFDPDLMDLRCEHCGHVEVVDEVALKDGAQALDLALPTERGHRWAEAERRFVCQQCSAVTILPVGEKSSACAFCGNAALLAAPEDVALLPPQGLLPMAFEAETAAQHVRAWLKRGFFAPDDLAKMARSGGLRPAYVPFWIFEATLTAKWQAEVREGSGRNARWVWRSGERTFFFSDHLEPGTRALPADLLRRVPAFDLTQLLVFKPEYLAAWPTAVYDISLADASLNAHEKMVKEARKQLLYKAAPGRDIRDLEVSPGSFSGEAYKLVMLPVWIGAYAYLGRMYRVLVNGQTGAVAGDKPVDWVKVALVALGAAIVIAFAAYLLYFFLPR
jgi:DNA-directed RNA polymerase subunit RPC12/RpoP